MTYRYAGTSLVIGTAGSAITHGITTSTSTGLAAGAPTEWSFCFSGAVAKATGNELYRAGAPSTTTFTLAATSANATADVFCNIPHSIIS